MERDSSESQVGALRSDLGVERVDEELLILDKKDNKLHRLNHIARIIWEEFDSGSGVDDIAEVIVGTFDISAEAALADVERTIAQFHELHLLESRASQDSSDRTHSRNAT